MQSTAEYLVHTEGYVELLCQNLDISAPHSQPAMGALQLASLKALQEHIRLWYEP